MRVVVTRPEAQAEPLAEALEALGHEVVRCPLIRVEPLGEEPIDASGYDWVVVTSQNGAAELARRLAAPPRRLVVAAEGARRLLVDERDADFLPLYRTVELAPESMPEGDVALLASPSAARALAAAGARIPVVAIGPQTAAAAREAGLEVVAEASTHDAEGLLAALASLSDH